MLENYFPVLLFLAIVGILTMFNQRYIIVGQVTLAYATLGCVFLIAGVTMGLDARQRAAAFQVE